MGGLLLLSQKNFVGLADLDKRNKNDHILAKRLISGFNSICIKVLAITEISTYLPKKKKKSTLTIIAILAQKRLLLTYLTMNFPRYLLNS